MTTTWPKAVHSAAQTRAIDAAIIAQGVPGPQLMQRAAEAVWAELQARWPHVGQLTVLCGKGNNGGDGFLVARLALLAGWKVHVLSLFDRAEFGGDALQALRAAAEAGVSIDTWQPGAELDGVVLDAMLGTGLQGQVREPFSVAISALNASGVPVVSVDIPSGLDADTGQVLGAAVKAALTVTFITLKPGLLTAAGPDQTGELVFAGLAALPPGMPKPALERLLLADWASALPSRPRAAHKGLFGHVVLVGGDRGMGGAIMLAAEAALRSGAGRVSVATRPEHVAPLLSRCPEIMALAIEEAEEAGTLLARADTLVIGPGLGRSEWSQQLCELAMAADAPKVLDADALNILAESVDGHLWLCDRDIITPHPAEAARLLGLKTVQVQADRVQALRSLVERFGCAVVLKGVGSLVAAVGDQGQPPGICTFGNPGMATAGMGDVLSGVAGALLAQGLPAGQAARYAVLVHALAGDTAAHGDHRGLLAGDLMMPLRHWLNA
ncbi:bifunctional ADP-dependent NAD(P)H-hydrate dehydratase/NAD(P)H-hydrate epimerase [Halopseudomonas pelagia]|uniref:bifunctional ADP-dependent NAD(P)H-hydrate dehydratase/NAD(P)H-hydrate epimerase n=1 Tax=Halopseudomonas pelagia TaxID=553151 RepID=UPI0003A69907|nr:bifunctional ADP-dependent NAD(P)H-hydrate dehydratase/NAD(P)H-hydrate epimerase [Halopseudomonas pelagia]